MPAIASNGQQHILVLKRTASLTVYIGLLRNKRRILDAYNTDFDKQYQLVDYDTRKAIDIWLKSTVICQDKAHSVMVELKDKIYPVVSSWELMENFSIRAPKLREKRRKKRTERVSHDLKKESVKSGDNAKNARNSMASAGTAARPIRRKSNSL